MNKIEISHLGGVEQTCLIPLLGRAKDARSKKPILNDPKAGEIVDRLSIDLHCLAKTKRLQVGACIRSAIYDHYVREFITQNPQGTVIELGCGLNARFERLDNGKIHWFDLDVPETIRIRKHFFPETPRRRLLSYSAFDREWLEIALEHGKPPFLLMTEAAIIYYPEDQVKGLFAMLADHFPGSNYLFDTVTPYLIENQSRYPDMRALPARLQWGVEDPKHLEPWDERYQLLSSVNFSNPPDGLISVYPFSFRAGYFIMKLLNSPHLKTYYVNMMRFGQ